MNNANIMKYMIIIEKGNESGYVVYTPALRGCVSQGNTKAEAMGSLEEAIDVYIESLLEDGLPIPAEVGNDAVELEVAVK